MSKSLFIFISGTSGAGKNTVISQVMKQHGDYKFLLSHTTRARRIDDKDDKYHHVSKEEFERLISTGDIIEYDMFNNNYYGVSKGAIKTLANTGDVVFKDISVKCVENAQCIFKDGINFVSVFLTQSKKVLKQRLIDRKYSLAEISSRLKLYKHEQSKVKNYDYLIFNNSLQKTVEYVNAIINTKTNNLPINTFESSQNILEKKIDKCIKRLEKNKRAKDVEVTAHENELYITSGINTYLAHLKSGKHITLKFVENNQFSPLSETEQKEWLKIQKLYK